MSAAILRADLDRYASHHAMSRDVAAGMQVAALLGWLEAQERREERGRLTPESEKTPADLSQPPVTRLRTDVEMRERLQAKRLAAAGVAAKRTEEDQTGGDHDD